MARTALSKNTTYGTLVTNARNEARMTTTGYSLLTDAYLYQIISLIIQRFALILNSNNKPMYRTKDNLTLVTSGSGASGEYYADASPLNPYWDSNVRLVHVTAANVRTPINVLDPNRIEDFAKLTSIEANTILALQLGWGFRIYTGSGITVTIATDVIEFTYDSQPIIASAVSGTYLDIADNLVPFVKDELVEYMLKYKGTLSSETFQRLKNERFENLKKV